MGLRFGWGGRISLQFVLVALPLAALLLVQGWMDLRRSSQLADSFPLHLQASTARKHYRQFVDGVTDAVDSGKLSAQALKALQDAGATVHGIGATARTDEATRLDADLGGLIARIEKNPKLENLLPQRLSINDLNERLQRLDESYETHTRAVIAEAQTGAHSQILMTGVAALLALALAAYFVRVMIARLTRPLHDGIRIAQAIATGNLAASRRVEGADETAQLLNALAAMNDALRDIVGKVRASSDGIHSASTEIATGNQDLSQRTEKAASRLQHTTSSVEQITRNVRQSASTASRANELASSASGVAAKGGEVIGQVVTTMGAIESSSQRISDIIGVIDSIAFQTNILALNAAVEAARAGDQGRGFAVVASEVRMLAQRSAAAALEIKGLINESVDRVRSGADLVVEAGRTMGEIVQRVRDVSELIAEINSSSASQAGEVDHLHQAISDLDRMTQQNAAMVEQSAAASASMKALAATLAQAVSVFQVEAAPTA